MDRRWRRPVAPGDQIHPLLEAAARRDDRCCLDGMRVAGSRQPRRTRTSMADLAQHRRVAVDAGYLRDFVSLRRGRLSGLRWWARCPAMTSPIARGDRRWPRDTAAPIATRVTAERRGSGVTGEPVMPRAGTRARRRPGRRGASSHVPTIGVRPSASERSRGGEERGHFRRRRAGREQRPPL